MMTNIRMEELRGTPLAALKNADLTHFVHALETLLRRKMAGTLMPGSCRAIEVTWRRQILSRIMMIAENIIEEAANLVGFDSFMEGASMSMSALCELLPDSHGTMRAIVVAHEPLFWEVMASACDLIMLRGWNADTLVSDEQAGFVDKMFLLTDSKIAMTADIEGLQRWLNAWNRLRQRKGAIIDRFVKNNKDERAKDRVAYQRTLCCRCRCARASLLRAGWLQCARAAPSAFQGLRRLQGRGVLLQGASSAGLECAQDGVQGGAQGFR